METGKLNVSVMIMAMVFMVMGCSFYCCNARDIVVGGPRSWTIPPTNDSLYYNRWAAHNRFLVGDNLQFRYKIYEDSVLAVTSKGYKTCDTANPLAYYTDGKTVVTLRTSGPHYFMSGVPGNCQRGQKLIVVVLADRKTDFTPPSEFYPSAAASHHAHYLFTTTLFFIVLASAFTFLKGF